MGTPEKKTVNVNSAEMRELRDKIRQANLDIAAMTAYRDDLVAKVQKRMGDATDLKVDGVLAFTYTPTKSFRWAEFAKAHPEIAETYTITVPKDELDKARLLKEHPTLVAPFQSRQFLVK